MDLSKFPTIVEKAVRIRKKNCMGLECSLDVYALVDDLDDAIDDAIQKAPPERRKPDEVMNWLRSVGDRKHDIHRGLIKGFVKNGKKCCLVWCPNPKSQLSMEAHNVQEVTELLKKIRRIHEEALLKTEQKVAAAAVKDFINFDSRRDVWEEIMMALQSPRISSIGVYGEAGVGKTMLVEEIKRKAKQMKLFDAVVMAKVTNNPDTRRIQDDVAHDLGLELPDKVTAADQIKSRLNNRKVLVILDDIWARIDLEEVGIPFGNKHKQKLKQPTEKKNEEISPVEEQTRCLLLMTSGDSGVLSGDMHAHKIIKVGRLKEEEARELFAMTASEQAKRRIAEINEIVKECNQLPLTISTIASTSEDKSLIQWRTTMKKLRLPKRVRSEVPSLYSVIEMRYSELESEELKKTLLLCSLMGHNDGIQDLLKYGIGLGLFPKATSIEEARDEALRLVKELRRSPSLLQKGGDTMHFDMHDLIQKVAISIASREHGLLDLTEDATEDMFDKKAMKECKWIYLSNGDAKRSGHLPYMLKCPQFTFFHLASKYSDLKIPENFFWGADGLRVWLGTILVSVMENLKNLQVLSLVGCDIEELPRETVQLAKLKLLNLSDCTKLKDIPPGILKSLSQLEELYLGNSFDQWEDIEKHDKRRNASLDELTQLIEEICGIIGAVLLNTQTLKLKHDGSIRSDKVKSLPNKVEELHLERLNGVKDVFNELDQNGFQELKYLHVKNIDLEIEHLFFKPEKEIHSEVLPKLEVLFLHSLKGLQKIFHGQFGKPSLERLRIITVTCCSRLKNLFPFSVAKQLHYLQEIRVTDCSDIVEIVDEEEEEDANVITDDVIELAAQIKCLRLQRLTEFISFSHEKIIRSRRTLLFNKKLVGQRRIWSLTKLIIEGCDQLENLFFESIGDCLEKLEHLEIRECKKMREIIVREAREGVSMFTSRSLKQLAIENCPELKGFVEDNRADKPIASTGLFHDNVYFPTLETMSISNLKNLNIIWCEFNSIDFFSLNFLHIKDLPNLIRLCQNREDRKYKGSELRSLEQLIIENCLQLNGPLFDEEFVCPNLKIMTVSYLKNLKIIWKTFCNLRSLRVTYCQNLSTIFPCNSGMLKKLLGSLEELEIIGCSSVKKVFELGRSEEHKLICHRMLKKLLGSLLIFQQLKVVTIADCPDMVTFASTISRDQEQGTSEPFFSTKFQVKCY
ncbi:hypothetical protein SLEP1_g48581 [Rubroshorea leprosula]|uniref:AAA+ ATPase domain-containing protein n=1 Tax=Rubroshorea leprosula TaxID=152421 RepID=A0AAV5LU54_9ROSI|nr:hypothetical protein SLEP1_g48581 [Rubroshorea leprosula]